MDSTAREVLEFVADNDVKFVRLTFCDLFGLQKNISIMADELGPAFEHGVAFDAHAIAGLRDVTRSDLLLFPDPGTLMVLPWRPGPGRVVRFYCDIRNPDGSPFVHDSRLLLKEAVAACERAGYACKVGAECEFYLFKTDEDGNPTDTAFDNGGYLDISPLDRGEDIRREVCLTLEEMGIRPESSHHEQGPGQNEIDFAFSDALTCADNLQTLKSVVKSVAARNGLFASFMPKPLPDAPGNGLHVNLSLAQNGQNIFKNADEGHSGVAESFIAGVLAHTPAITLFLNPVANSYERFGAFEAPRYVSWSRQNRSQLVRIPVAQGEKVRMELRSPDPSVNPYLAFALIIAAGLDGIGKGLPLPPAVDGDPADATGAPGPLESLPTTMGEALSLAKDSGFVKGVIGEGLLAKYIAIKWDEADEAHEADEAGDKERFYRERYFAVL